MVDGYGEGLTAIHPPPPTNLLLLAGNRLCGALAGTRIGVRALATNRQRAAVAQAAIAAQIHQPLDIHRNFATQIALDLIVTVDGFANGQDLGVGKLIDTTLGGNADLVDNLLGEFLANAVDVLKRDHHALVGRNVDAGYTGHLFSFSIWAGFPHDGPSGAFAISRVRWRPAPAGVPDSKHMPRPFGQARFMPERETGRHTPRRPNRQVFDATFRSGLARSSSICRVTPSMSAMPSTPANRPLA